MRALSNPKHLMTTSARLCVGFAIFWMASVAQASLPQGQAGSLAEPPSAQQIGGMRITDDTALYQNISEINSPKLGHVDFDGDLERLSQMERRYVDRARIGYPSQRRVKTRSSAPSNVQGKSSRALPRR